MAEVEEASMTTIAVEAIESRDIEALTKCLDRFEDVDLWLPTSGMSLLEHAVEGNFVSAIELLFSRMPPKLQCDVNIKQAFVLAMRRNLQDVIRMFLEGALTGRLEMSLLDIFMHAVNKEQRDIALKVIRIPEFDINSENPWDSEHPLSVVIGKQCLHLAELLVDRGAIIDAPNNKGETALVTACAFQYPDCCRLLLMHGANPNHRSLLGLSPLLACYNFSKDLLKCGNIIDILLQAGLNVNKEKWIEALAASNSSMSKCLKALAKQPQSLKLLSFVKIRAHMAQIHHGVSIMGFLEKLPLPPWLIKYLTMSAGCVLN